MKFWALEEVSEQYDGYHAWEDRSIDESYGLFLTEEDAKKFLEDNGLSKNAQNKKYREDYEEKIRVWKEKHADAIAEYDRAISAGISEGLLVSPERKFDYPQCHTADSWHEITTISLNDIYAKED